MPARRKPRVGDIVEIHFDDHTENIGTLLAIVAWGRLAEITRRCYSIHSWEREDGEPVENSTTRFDIVRKAVTSIKVLR